MSIAEIYKQEHNNRSSIVLRKEGIFWHAYETSAFLFVRMIKGYQPGKKHYKIIDQEVVSIGFPDSGLEQLISVAMEIRDSNIERGENLITVHFSDPDISEFSVWKEGVSLKESVPFVSGEEKEIVEKIRSFPVVSRTPLEAQAFIIELQQKINGTIR